MHWFHRITHWFHCRRGCVALLGLLPLIAVPGCQKARSAAPSVSEPASIEVVKPQRRKIVRVVGQPSFVESYERTSIFPKVTGYIENWKVDIGDRVKKGQTLAILFVPELREDWETKKRMVQLDKERVDVALAVAEVAEADVLAAEARLQEAVAIEDKYKSDVLRWESEVKRLKREVDKGVVDPQVHLESENQARMSTAGWNAAKASIAKAKAELKSKKATLKQDLVDVKAARVRVSVAESDAARLAAWVGYLTLTAPYDGVIVARNANTGDFVMPVTGDPTTTNNSPHLAPNKAAPIFVIDRTDVVRIFVDVPEADANYIRPGTEASVMVKAFRDQWISAKVTRTSWALNVKSRTLRAEIDLRNTDKPEAYADPGHHPIVDVTSNNGIQILPGMYAYGKVIIERPNVWAIPESALIRVGEKTYCWSFENGHAVKVEVQTGVSDGQWIEVTNRQYPGLDGKPPQPWQPFDGSEQVVVGDLATIADGAALQVGGDEKSKEDGHAPLVRTTKSK